MTSIENLGSINGDEEFRNLLKTILNRYQVSSQTLSKITGIEEDVILNFANNDSDLSCFPEESFTSFSQVITFLSIGMQMVNENDRVKGVMDHLIHELGFSVDTLALYARLESEDVRQFLDDCNSLQFEKRYRLAVTSLFLHYLFKPSA